MQVMYKIVLVLVLKTGKLSNFTMVTEFVSYTFVGYFHMKLDIEHSKNLDLEVRSTK
jgi:hypothetical protein